MARGGAEVIRGGRGYSTRKVQKGDVVIRTISGGGGGRRNSSVIKRTPNVKVNGFSVIIDGKGFSVPLSEQAKFIRERTGGVGASASAAIKQAEKAAEEASRKAAQEIKRKAAQDLARLKEVAAVSSATQKAQIAREQLRLEAIRRGRAFTRLEAQRFLKQKAGPNAITNLRAGNRADRGFIGRVRQSLAQNRSKQIKNVNLGRQDIKLSSSQMRDLKNLTKTNKPIQQTTTKIPSQVLLNRSNKDKIPKALTKAWDLITLGSQTEKSISKEQTQLNKRIEKFNKKYGGREISPKEFERASAELNFINQEQKKIDKKWDKLVNSRKNKIKDFLSPINPNKRITIAQQKELSKKKPTKAVQKQIKRIERQVESTNKKISELSKGGFKGRKGVINQGRVFLLNLKLGNLQNDINSLKLYGFAVPRGGTLPIVPASRIPTGITKIGFVGTQKTGKGGKIVTDIVFTTKKGTRGVARGVTVIKKGKESASIVGGRFGRVSVKLLKGQRRIDKIKSFVGAERGLSRTVKFTEGQLRKIAKFSSRVKKKGVIRAIKSNIKGLQQASVGRVATVKGNKFVKPFIKFPSGRVGSKLSKAVSLDDFASVSAVLSKKDISAIIGRTITNKGAKAEFVGLINSLSKDSGKVITLSGTKKQQYSKALQKLYNSVAAAVANAEKQGVSSKSLKLAAAAQTLSAGNLVRQKPSLSSLTSKNRKIKSPTQRTKLRTKVKTKTIPPKKVVIKGSKSKVLQLKKSKKKIESNQKNIQRQINKQKTLVKRLNRLKPRTKQLSKAKQKLRSLQRLILRLKQKQVQKLKQINRLSTPSRSVNVRKGILLAKKRRKKSSKKRVKKSSKRYYDVYAKPVGGKRFLIVNDTPLIKSKAEDLRNYVVDTSLSRQAKLKTSTRKPRKSKSKKIKTLAPSGYGKKTRNKFRNYKIVKGRKKKLSSGRVIELRKNILDTLQEKKKIGLKRRISQIKSTRRKRTRKSKPIRRKTTKRKVSRRITRPKKRVVRRTRKRKITPTQRRILLKRLEKARRVRRRKNKN